MVGFTFKGGNRYTDSADITFGSSFDLPDLVYLLTNVDGVTVDSVGVTSDVVDDSSVLKIVGADQRREGAWHAVDAHKPLLLKAHSKATLRLRYAGGTHGPAFQVAVPAGTTGFRGYLSASEAESYPFERGFPRTLAGVTKLVQKAERNDQARIDFSAFGGKARSVTSHQVTTPGNKVVTGHLNLKVKVS